MKRFLRIVTIIAATGFVISVPAQAVSDPIFYSNNDIIFYDEAAGDPVCGNDATIQASVSKVVSSVPQDLNLGEGASQRTVNLANQLMADLELTAEQAAGIIGNLMQEAGQDLPPDINQGGRRGAPTQVFVGGNAYGWAQWDGPRKASFIAFAVDNGYVSSASQAFTDGANYAYLLHELTDTYEAKVVPILQQASSVEEATDIFQREFERAGSPNITARNSNASQVLSWMQGGESGSTVGVSGVGCGPTEGATHPGDWGQMAFPVGSTRSDVNNPQMFASGTTDMGGHGYIAYDIMSDPGTPVYAFIDGTVNLVRDDSCSPRGKLITAYNETHDVTVTYIHLGQSGHVQLGDQIRAGEQIATVGDTGTSCGGGHLHIDVVEGRSRPACARETLDICPDIFIDIGPDLYRLWQTVGEGTTNV